MDQKEAYLHQTFDDIIFEGRNRKYGAYNLRSAIPFHTYTGLILIAATITLILGVRILYKVLNNMEDADIPEYTIETISLTEPPPLLEQLPPAVPPAAAPKMNDVIQEIEVKKDTEVKQTEFDQQENKGDSTSTGTSAEGDNNQSLLNGQGNTVYNNPEVKAQYIGGDKALKKYLSTNLKYPQVARENNIHGTVVVLFVIREDGSVTDVKIKQGIGGGCDQEAIRIVENMKNWKPGRQGDKPVPTLVALPITFGFQ